MRCGAIAATSNSFAPARKKKDYKCEKKMCCPSSPPSPSVSNTLSRIKPVVRSADLFQQIHEEILGTT